MARVLLGVTGGIAAYKACELSRLLVKDGHEVIPLLTPGAERFVTRETFDALARRPRGDDPYPHLEGADLLVIAPLTANTLAKLAHGLADSVLTEAVLAHRGPILAAPAMNHRMWAHPATQANAKLAQERGVELIGPEEGELAEGDSGIGRMAEPEAIHARCRELLDPSNSLLVGKKVVVSAGGTREPLDAVRYVGNRASGRMGVALAAEAVRRGANVTLLAANLAVPAPAGVAVVETPTADDVLRETLAHADADLIVMAAAVSDYRPAAASEKKRAKSDESWTVDLVPTVDVLRALAKGRANGQVVVGFAADQGERGLARAREKLEQKGTDLIVFNDISRSGIGFDSTDNEVVLISPGGEQPVAKAPKPTIARVILDEAERILKARDGG